MRSEPALAGVSWWRSQDGRVLAIVENGPHVEHVAFPRDLSQHWAVDIRGLELVLESACDVECIDEPALLERCLDDTAVHPPRLGRDENDPALELGDVDGVKSLGLRMDVGNLSMRVQSILADQTDLCATTAIVFLSASVLRRTIRSCEPSCSLLEVLLSVEGCCGAGAAGCGTARPGSSLNIHPHEDAQGMWNTLLLNGSHHVARALQSTRQHRRKAAGSLRALISPP